MAVFILLDGSVCWTYLLDLFYGFTYSCALYIRFGGFIYSPYLWTLVSAYTVFMLIANLVSFSHISERNTNKFLSIYISHVLMEKIFRSTLRHHSCLIKLPLLQLHHHTLLIKLTYIASLHNIPYTCPLIKLTIITSLSHYCHMCAISNLHCSNIIPHCIGSTHLIPPEFHSIQLKFTLILLSSKRLILKANVKARRSTDDHPKCIALNVNIPQRLQSRSSFRRKAEELSSLLPPDLQHRQNIIHFPSPPWQQSSSHTGRISTSVPGITSRADDKNIKRQCSLSTIISYQADYVVYTDGSAS